MKIELPYLSKITLKKKSHSKDFLCFNRKLFEIEEISGKDIYIENDFLKEDRNMVKKNYYSLCSVKDFCELINLVSDVFISKEKIKNNLVTLLFFGEKVSDYLDNPEILKIKNDFNLGIKMEFLLHYFLFLWEPKDSDKTMIYLGNKDIENYEIISDTQQDISFFEEKLNMLKIHNNTICVPFLFTPIVASIYLESFKNKQDINSDIFKNMLVENYVSSNCFKKNIETMTDEEIQNYIDFKKTRYNKFRIFLNTVCKNENLNGFDLVTLSVGKYSFYQKMGNNKRNIFCMKDFLYSSLFYEKHDDEYLNKLLGNSGFKDFCENTSRKYPPYENISSYLGFDEENKDLKMEIK